MATRSSALLLILATGASGFAPTLPRTRAPHAASRTSGVQMPIGVPKVAYKVPGAMQADWVDLYNRLYRERILFLGQQVADDIANQMIGIMLYLDSEDNNKPITMYINSPGGSVTAGFAMFDTMRHIKSDVSTVNIGLAASMGSFLLAGGTKGKRLALPHSRTMIHQPAAGGIQGQASDIKVEAQQILRVRDQITDYYAMLSGQPRERILLDIDRDNFMSAQQAMDYGLIDKIVQRPTIANMPSSSSESI